METEAPFTTAGRVIRVSVTLVMLALLVAGSWKGDDDDFPFGPFRMYSTTNKVNKPVVSTRLEAVQADHTKFVLRSGSTGFRRAELEGQLPRFRKQPALLAALARAYAQRTSHAQPLREIAIVQRRHELKNGRPTGKHHDRIVVAWHNPDFPARDRR